jgi:hypothetical protein
MAARAPEKFWHVGWVAKRFGMADYTLLRDLRLTDTPIYRWTGDDKPGRIYLAEATVNEMAADLGGEKLDTKVPARDFYNLEEVAWILGASPMALYKQYYEDLPVESRSGLTVTGGELRKHFGRARTAGLETFLLQKMGLKERVRAVDLRRELYLHDAAKAVGIPEDEVKELVRTGALKGTARAKLVVSRENLLRFIDSKRSRRMAETVNRRWE